MMQIANEPRFWALPALCSVVVLPSEHCPAAVWKCIDLFFKAKEPIMASQPAECVLNFHLEDSISTALPH